MRLCSHRHAAQGDIRSVNAVSQRWLLSLSVPGGVGVLPQLRERRPKRGEKRRPGLLERLPTPASDDQRGAGPVTGDVSAGSHPALRHHRFVLVLPAILRRHKFAI